jgi:chromosome segregation ATPase
MNNQKSNESPIFVRIDEYKDFLDVIELIKGKIAEAKTTLQKINELKNSEDTEIEVWTNELEEINRKISLIDRTLFEPEAF